MADEVLIEGLPMQVNLSLPGRPDNTIGRAKILKNEDGTMTIEIVIHQPGSERLQTFIKEVNLMEIGFAGVMREPAKWRDEN